MPRLYVSVFSNLRGLANCQLLFANCLRRRFQYLQLHTTDIRNQLRPHSKRQRNVSARNVAGLQTIHNRSAEILEHAHDHFLQRVTLISRLDAIQHFSKNDSAYAVEFIGHSELHQHPVDPVWFLGNVFDEQDRVVGLDFEMSSQRSRQHGKAPSMKASFGTTLLQYLNSCRRNLPGRGALKSMLPTGKLNTMGRSNVLCNHGTVKSDEARSVGNCREK